MFRYAGGALIAALAIRAVRRAQRVPTASALWRGVFSRGINTVARCVSPVKNHGQDAHATITTGLPINRAKFFLLLSQ